MADVDRDGELEIIAGMDGKNHVYNYRQEGTFTREDLPGSFDTNSIACADMNLDGYPEIIEGNWGSEDRILMNDGNGQFTPDILLGGGGTMAMVPGDMDADGDADLVVLKSSGYAGYYGSTYCSRTRYGIDIGGDGMEDARVRDNFPVDGFIPELGALNTTAMAWGDYDNDGDADIAIGNYAAQNYLATNNGAGSFTLTLQFASGMALAMDWGDYDNDGDLDLAVGNNGQNHLFTNTGSGFDQRSEFGEDYTVGMEWEDVNLDGRPDLIVINFGTQSKLYVNHGSHFEAVNAFGAGNAVSVAARDYDRDGDVDVAVGKLLSEQNKLFINQDGKSFLETDVFGNRPITAMEWGDFDNDGDLDLAVSHKGFNNAMYRNNAGSFIQEDCIGSMDAIAMKVTDYNLDGNEDVVLISYTGLLETYSGDGAGSFLLDRANDLNSSLSCLDVVHIDKDAFPDIALGTTGSNLLCRNMGDELELSGIEDTINSFLSKNGNVTTISIDITSTGTGVLNVREPNFQYSEPPQCNVIPSIFSMPEDTLDERVMDLSEYFFDDVDRSDELGYRIINNSISGTVHSYIHEGHFLALDAANGSENDNFTGMIELIVEAIDSTNLSVVSNPFNITIMEVNDPPARGSPIPDILIDEGGEYEFSLHREEYFIDGDGDKLYYDIMVDPLHEISGYINFSAKIDGGNLTVTAQDNGTCSSVPLWIFADDDKNVNTAANSADFVHQEVSVTICNINDPPYLSDIEDVFMFMNEDLHDAFNMEDYVVDADTPLDELSFKVEEISQTAIFDVQIDWNHFVDIKVMVKDYVGTCHVTVSVSDGEYTDYAEFDIVVREKNNPPTCSLLLPLDNSIIPTSSVNLMWEGDDGDGDDIVYNIYFSRKSSGAKFHRIGYEGTSLMIDGLLDDTSYYWQVYPEDKFETGECLDKRYTFTVDLDVDVPRTTLLFPEDGATVNSPHLTLSWSKEYPGALQVTYEVFLYENSETPQSYLSGYDREHLVVEDLSYNSTYFWMIIPRAGNIQGECISGTYSFSVIEGAKETYLVDLLFEGTDDKDVDVVVIPGRQKMFNITLHNMVLKRRTVDLSLDGHPKIVNKIMFSRDSFVLSPPGEGEEYIKLKVYINLQEDFESGKYLISISALLNEQKVSPDLNIILDVREMTTDNGTKAVEKERGWVIPAAAVFLVLALVIFVVISRRKARSLAFEDVPEGSPEDLKSGGTKAPSSDDTIAGEVEPIPMVGEKSTDRKTAYDGEVISEDFGDGRARGRYDHPVFPFPANEGNQYAFTQAHNNTYMSPFGLGSFTASFEEHKRSIEDYYQYILDLIQDAHREGADITDAEKLTEEIEDRFKEARSPEDYNKILEYCNAVGNAINRSMSSLEKKN